MLSSAAFLVLLYGIFAGDWTYALSGGVMALVFGLEGLGVLVLGRWRRTEGDE